MSVSINMRPGHKKKFTSPGFMQQAKEEMAKLEEKSKREEAKREREKEELEKKSIREQQEQEELANELSKIERKRILNEAKAKARSNRDELEHEGTKPTAPDTKPTTAKNTATEPAQLAACKEYAAFISHKKMHTQFADSSETLSIRLKVHVIMMCVIGMYSRFNIFSAARTC